MGQRLARNDPTERFGAFGQQRKAQIAGQAPQAVRGVVQRLKAGGEFPAAVGDLGDDVAQLAHLLAGPGRVPRGEALHRLLGAAAGVFAEVQMRPGAQLEIGLRRNDLSGRFIGH